MLSRKGWDEYATRIRAGGRWKPRNDLPPASGRALWGRHLHLDALDGRAHASWTMAARPQGRVYHMMILPRFHGSPAVCVEGSRRRSVDGLIHSGDDPLFIPARLHRRPSRPPLRSSHHCRPRSTGSWTLSRLRRAKLCRP